jgi:hypothetical protein
MTRLSCRSGLSHRQQFLKKFFKKFGRKGKYPDLSHTQVSGTKPQKPASDWVY